MLEKLKNELEFNEFMIEETKNEIKELEEKIKNCGDVGVIKNLLSELEFKKEESRKYAYAVSTLKRIMR